ncbi:Polyketide cyclase / dehydrase and lipid transport [Geodermatophilus dictyosporus]|uniref:Polyketide cyclase / dehydrase and lipid transport n=1 Tax=Geodermatophilus dictyosporus TaxID=1523247 RepID=A0A1I5SD66_9ACTN|nr:SRPBCC family protein [Geodermatophilus dictyosporus]SFP68681.1 Polyketide cyclase / dehydrase and lipid transport [Geodermatophilus dictyosporus]
MTTASGSREVAAPRGRVWRALAVLEPYCAVCDVSYVVDGAAAGPGTRFVCVPGRLGEDEQPRDGAPRGEIVEWEPERVVATRLQLTPETWTTRIELADGAAGGTLVTITLTHEPRRVRLADRLSRTSMQRVVQRTVDGELDKLPAHVEQVAAD